ncbi:MAG: thermonuclease family protein [Pseudomonadota bacterium]|nr:thermonuclease family protein [Pseudomonadota bacterium]
MICRLLPIALAVLCASPPVEGVALRVIDGDTVAVGERRIRLMGLDAPEARGAKCPREKILGVAAKLRLAALTASPERVRLEPSGRRDRYGRELARLLVDGRDVATILIGEGLAHPYSGGRRQGWC